MIRKKPFIICDSREKQPILFDEDEYFAGTKIMCLPTGDYTIQGLESKFIVERKLSISELAQNFTQERFKNELERLKSYEYKYILCEFDMYDVANYPNISSISPKIQRCIRIRPPFLFKNIAELQFIHNIPIFFAGFYAKPLLHNLLKGALKLL